MITLYYLYHAFMIALAAGVWATIARALLGGQS